MITDGLGKPPRSLSFYLWLIVRSGHPHSSRRFDCVAGILRTFAAYSSKGTVVAALKLVPDDSGAGGDRTIRPALRGQTLSLPLVA